MKQPTTDSSAAIGVRNLHKDESRFESTDFIDYMIPIPSVANGGVTEGKTSTMKNAESQPDIAEEGDEDG